MKSLELQKIGLNKEQIRAVQALHGKDLKAFRDKLGCSNINNATRKETAKAMLNTLHDVDSLNELIKVISELI